MQSVLRERIFATSLLSTILVVALSCFIPELGYFAGILSLFCLISGLFISNKRNLFVGLLISMVGLLTLFVAITCFDYELTIASLLRLNQDFITMIACVTFLRLVTPKSDNSKPRLKGTKAILRTGIVIHYIGAVINVIIVGLAAEKLRAGGKLSLADASLISKTFMMASIWTPFWVAVSVAASYVPGANFIVYTSIGLVASFIMVILFSLDNLRMRTKEELENYEGFSLSAKSVIIPAILVILIAGSHFFFPTIPVPRLVVGCVLLVTFFGLLPKLRWRTLGSILRYGYLNLHNSKSETVILISAGLLTVGFLALQESTTFSLPITQFTVWVAWGLVVTMVILSILGIHQFITFSVAASLLVPLSPEPTLFVIAATLGWSLGSMVGPLSGVTNYLNGHFQVGNFQLVRSNLPSAICGVCLALPILMLINNFA